MDPAHAVAQGGVQAEAQAPRVPIGTRGQRLGRIQPARDGQLSGGAGY